MESQPKLGKIYKRVLLVEDNAEICAFYKEFFDAEELPVDICNKFPVGQDYESNFYDILVCDWLIGSETAKLWLSELYRKNKLPKITLVVTGLFGVESKVGNLPLKVIYKPFDFDSLKEFIVQYNLI